MEILLIVMGRQIRFVDNVNPYSEYTVIKSDNWLLVQVWSGSKKLSQTPNPQMMNQFFRKLENCGLYPKEISIVLNV